MSDTGIKNMRKRTLTTGGPPASTSLHTFGARLLRRRQVGGWGGPNSGMRVSIRQLLFNALLGEISDAVPMAALLIE